MKRCLIILIAFCGLSAKTFGQSASAAIDSLVKYRIITPKQRPALVSELKRKGTASYRVALLAGLEDIWLQKIFHINPRKVGLFSYDVSGLNKKSQDSVNTSLRLMLERINKAGLLTDRVYKNTIKDIDSNQYVAEVQLIAHLTEMSSRLERLTPNKLLPVAESLYKNGILGDSSFQRLQSDIRNEKIESAFQLNDYCKFDRVFNVENYTSDTILRLEQFHHDVAAMLPWLNFTNFAYTAVPDSGSEPGGVNEIKYKVSLTCNGQVYKHSGKLLNYGTRQGKKHSTDMFAETYYRIFNKILADQHSPFRLHGVLFSAGNAPGDDFQHFALIALRAEQTEVFEREPCLSYMLVTMETYDNMLTSGRIDSAMTEWRRAGLFSHLSETEIEKAIDDAQAADLFSVNDLLKYFPQITYSLDSALTSGHNSYTDLLSRLAKITHGVFNPTEITQKKINGGVKLQYRFKDKSHSYILKTAYWWQDAEFPAFLKQLGPANDLQGNFYDLPYENTIIFLTKQQYADAVQYKSFDFGEKSRRHAKQPG